MLYCLEDSDKDKYVLRSQLKSIDKFCIIVNLPQHYIFICANGKSRIVQDIFNVDKIEELCNKQSMPFFYNSCNCRNKIICIETYNFARNRLFYVWKDPLIHLFKKLKEDPEITLQMSRTQLGFVLFCWIAHTTAVLLTCLSRSQTSACCRLGGEFILIVLKENF